MKVVLRDHVEHLGRRGEIVNVAVGYARNYLLPKQLALPATAGNMKQIEHQQRVWAAKEAKEVGEAQALADRISALSLTITKKAGESGTLYGSVTNGEIAEKLAEHGIRVERRRIVLADPIKNLGHYEVPVRIHREVTSTVALAVLGEDGASGPREVEPVEAEPGEFDEALDESTE